MKLHHAAQLFFVFDNEYASSRHGYSGCSAGKVISKVVPLAGSLNT